MVRIDCRKWWVLIAERLKNGRREAVTELIWLSGGLGRGIIEGCIKRRGGAASVGRETGLGRGEGGGRGGGGGGRAKARLGVGNGIVSCSGSRIASLSSLWC